MDFMHNETRTASESGQEKGVKKTMIYRSIWRNNLLHNFSEYEEHGEVFSSIKKLSSPTLIEMALYLFFLLNVWIHFITPV